MSKFHPIYAITNETARALMHIEAIREHIAHTPLNPQVLKHLRQTARLQSIHYSTAIEGNRLSMEQVEEVILHHRQIKGLSRDELEIKGYDSAQKFILQWANKKEKVSEIFVKKIHALVMGGGKDDAKATPYREGQNVIREGRSGSIVYLPPEAQDVPLLMKELVTWINESMSIPAPLVAGIAHYQFATIHPCYDGNGRTARLLATAIMHQRGYDLKGVFSIDEYYAENLSAYYHALTIGPSHNYYSGRAESDITPWIDYFCHGMAQSFEKISHQMTASLKRGE